MTQPTKILIVDDSPEDCVMYRRQLEQGGAHDFDFQVAHTARDGLKRCQDQSPDCVLLDFNLPDSDGLDFLTQLRQQYGENGPPVVMLTGQGNEAVAVQAMKLGAQDYLVKGLAGDGLRHSIRCAIQQIAFRRQIDEQQREVARLSAERAKLIAELSDADCRKNDFLAALAHELRNPLGPIRNAAIIIGMNSSSLSPDAESARNIIDRQVNHMTRLIDDLLDVSRIVRGKITLRSELVELNALCKLLVEDHRSEFDVVGQTLTLELPQHETWVNGDPTRLRQVLGNILDNSRKFTPAGGNIDVSLRLEPTGSLAILRVVDSGEGLDSVTLERMFEIFSQADRSLDRSRGGLGLGLAIVKGIVELHGGRVEATSEGPGRGCEIKISLPLATSAPRGAATPKKALRSSKALRILVVEDNRDAAESLRMLLQKLGHQATVAATGAAALELAKEFRPELVICDIGLSDGMSGYVVAQSFRADPAFASAYLIALTGYGQAEDQARAREAGFDLHLTKPISIDTLLELPNRIEQRV